MMGSNHAVTDRASRLSKARKIEALIGGDLRGQSLLDLGCGSGYLSAYFQEAGADVTAADTRRETLETDVPFTALSSKRLPFPDAAFDMVVFNHVIEHVGDAEHQLRALDEIHRVLRPGGSLYLAVPSKWALIEPHFRIPLLGAMPRPLADRMVRILHGQPEYDCYPLDKGELYRMLSSRFARVEDVAVKAVEWVIEHEIEGLPRKLMRGVPRSMFGMLKFAFPTHIMLATKADMGTTGVR